MKPVETGANLIELEAWIRSGKIEQAKRALLSLSAAGLKRELRLPLANLCRRVGLIHQGLRVLTPLMQVERGKWNTEANSSELAEYAVLLQRGGSIQEALWTLGKVDRSTSPEAYLYEAFCHFGSWDYRQAAVSLHRYLEGELTPYQKLIGRVNLAAAFVTLGERESALELLDGNIAVAKEDGYGRLLGNCLELRAQVHFQTREFSLARTDLQSAENVHSANRSTDFLFIKKWNAIIDAVQGGSVDKLKLFREEALQSGHWESVRETDRFALQIEFDRASFDHLILGTPYEPYREMIRSEHVGREPAEHLSLGGGGPSFDLERGEWSDREATVTPNVHRLLDALSRDFYRPIGVGGLFAALFPGEHFDVLSSIHRVHQSIYRARKWMEGAKLGIEIKEEDGDYRLLLNDVAVRVPLRRQPIERGRVRLDILRERFGAGEFSMQAAAEALQLSPTSMKALLKEGLEEGALARIGAGPATRYHFAQAQANAA